MVSFKELHEADFSGISDAADAWSGVAKSLTSLDDRVTKDLTPTAQRAGWEGTAADGATKVLQGIDGDFKQASKVATALASIMKAAAEDFAAARRELDTAIHDAQTDKMTVTADGVVNWTLPKEARNDTDSATLAQELRTKAEAIQTRLTKAVEKAAGADQRAAAALRGDIGTSTTSFNPAPYGGGPVADANRAKTLLAKADDLTPPELKKLQDLLAANAGNKDFATTLINGLEYHGKTGQDALLAYSGIYDGLAHGKRHAHDFQAVLDGLSVSLATATHDGGMGKDWENQLLAAARRRDGADGYNTNYPALTALMGAKGTFDKAFLLKVGNDLVDYERGSKDKGEDLWGPKWTGRPYQTDPMGGLTNALSRNPEASKDFLDPGKGKNLDYLLHERKWPDQEKAQKAPSEQTASRTAFGYALEAATTGRDPHGDQPVVRPHDRVMSQIMDETMKSFAGSGPGDKTSLPAGLRRPMADMIADYAADMHEILGKEKLYGPSQPDGLTVTSDQLLRLIRGAAEDPSSYAVIHSAETQEIAHRLDQLDRDAMTPDVTGRAKPRLESLVHHSAATLGALDAVFADAALDHADADNKTVDWQAKMTYHAIGGVVGFIPEFGDAAQRLVDVGTSMWADSAKGEIDTHLKGNLSSHFSAGRQQLDAMLNYKLVESGYDHFALDGDGSVPDQLKRSAGSAYNTGIDNTYRTVFGRA
ncbi:MULTISPECIES: hypothetical protein [Kitasatospora]|uniref:AG2 protein n=1 Tax=Kitasatospora cathayae TaxID=3004092 RepID=A0ABY7PXK2_9ACTN|nr:hypothetical protein [Kitasatospora sp. HUAS 3-15]WBP85168.1 hypothetical protein O1G21_04390 [Kitasatospora sp. HUAS 3-15]